MQNFTHYWPTRETLYLCHLHHMVREEDIVRRCILSATQALSLTQVMHSQTHTQSGSLNSGTKYSTISIDTRKGSRGKFRILEDTNKVMNDSSYCGQMRSQATFSGDPLLWQEYRSARNSANKLLRKAKFIYLCIIVHVQPVPTEYPSSTTTMMYFFITLSSATQPPSSDVIFWRDSLHSGIPIKIIPALCERTWRYDNRLHHARFKLITFTAGCSSPFRRGWLAIHCSVDLEAIYTARFTALYAGVLYMQPSWYNYSSWPHIDVTSLGRSVTCTFLGSPFLQ